VVCAYQVTFDVIVMVVLFIYAVIMAFWPKYGCWRFDCCLTGTVYGV